MWLVNLAGFKGLLVGLHHDCGTSMLFTEVQFGSIVRLTSPPLSAFIPRTSFGLGGMMGCGDGMKQGFKK